MRIYELKSRWGKLLLLSGKRKKLCQSNAIVILQCVRRQFLYIYLGCTYRSYRYAWNKSTFLSLKQTEFPRKLVYNDRLNTPCFQKLRLHFFQSSNRGDFKRKTLRSDTKKNARKKEQPIPLDRRNARMEASLQSPKDAPRQRNNI